MSDPLHKVGARSDPSFSTWLRARRKIGDLTHETLAERVGCSVQMIRKLEAGQVRPSPLLAARLTACLVPAIGPERASGGPPFGEWLRQQRQAHDLTQAELADLAGRSRS